MKTLKHIIIAFILILSASISTNAQILIDSVGHHNRNLTWKEDRLAHKKGLDSFEMKVLLNKGFTYKQIKETPTEELKSNINIEKVDLRQHFKDLKQKNEELEKEIDQLYQQINELKIKIINRENYITELEERIKTLEADLKED